jgi:hypothetical protein
MSVNYINVIGWFWLLLAVFCLFVFGLSVKAMFAFAGSPAFRYSEWSPLVATISLSLLLLFLLSGLAFIFSWRFRWWWQIPAALALTGICYLIWASNLA